MADYEWDERKLRWTLRHRQIDFVDFMDVFDDPAHVM